ncbi:unnamed protein product [Angiostrongylus costaricensis]|uniref:DRBM domain-containing protein n=1 Tax=Angiostrongylus costaricensis TaxID=334426 RepID=A0A158PL07_ANGCS|nr:unnamed protein product [Angiostrongylus costaricensis]
MDESGPAHKKMFTVQLLLTPEEIFEGSGASIKKAQQAAAAAALAGTSLAMPPEKRKKKGIQIKHQSQETPSEGDSIPKHKQKSVISQVHECALQMKLNVEFEVIKEVGPPHDRSYVVRCSLKNPKNEVKGRKKKEATQTACANVLSRLENSPLFIASSLYKLQKRVLNSSREPKRKTIVKDMKMDPTYGHQINPISRLIQVLQARCEDEPQFELVSEQGQSRYKEFTVQVSCGKRICCGSGPNKRLAKRAAAEAMLAEIGYVKPLPPPGKSLLKKKTDSPLNIGNLFRLLLTSKLSNSQQTSLDPSSFLLTDGESMESSSNVPPSPGRRRVTFSNQVKACPPPEDSNYPEPELAPLKADVLIEGRVRRLRRTKEAKRILTSILHFFAGTTDSSESCKILSAKRRLEMMSETFKFSVQYTNFPKVGSC